MFQLLFCCGAQLLPFPRHVPDVRPSTSELRAAARVAAAEIPLLQASSAVLTEKLGDRRWPVREAAERRLRASAAWHDAALLGACDSADAEVCDRARRVKSELVGRYLLSLEPYPCIDAAWYDTVKGGYRDIEPDSEFAAMRSLLSACGPDPWPWTNYRTACRLWAGRMLERGESEETVTAWVNRLKEADAAAERNLCPRQPPFFPPPRLRMPAGDIKP